MTKKFESSEQALPALKKQVSSATAEQIAVAKSAGVDLAPELPRLVADSKLRDRLSELLDTAAPSDPKPYQRDLLKRLADEADVAMPVTQTRAEADAWIWHCNLLLRIRAHEEHRLERGDLVRRFGDFDDAIGKVSSIDSEGRVWLQGRGLRLWPDQLEIVARARDDDDEAATARLIADNRRAASTIQQLTLARQSELEAYSPPEPATADDLKGLRAVIDSADCEEPIQRYLDDHPQLLASLLSGSHRYVRSQVQLGGKYVPDYMLAEVDSTGFRWIYVELETPNSPVILKNGKDLHDKARTGVNQIKHWQEWIASNLAMARQLQAEDGWGLPGIRQHDEGLVLVGRRQFLNNDPKNVRRQLREHTGIHVHTYDWLIKVIRESMSATGIPLGASYYLSRD